MKVRVYINGTEFREFSDIQYYLKGLNNRALGFDTKVIVDGDTNHRVCPTPVSCLNFIQSSLEDAAADLNDPRKRKKFV